MSALTKPISATTLVQAGQPCGDSHIPDEHECRIGGGGGVEVTNKHGEKFKLTVGAEIGFKSDVEQSSKIKEVSEHPEFRGRMRVRVNVHEGGYAGKDKWIDAKDLFPV